MRISSPTVSGRLRVVGALAAVVLGVHSVTTVAQANNGKAFFDTFIDIIDKKIKDEELRKQSLMSERQLRQFFTNSVVYGSVLKSGDLWTLNFDAQAGQAKYTYSNGSSKTVMAGILGNQICFVFGPRSTDCRQISVWRGEYKWVNPDTGKASSRILFRQAVSAAQLAGHGQPPCLPGFECNCSVGVILTTIN